MKQKVAIAVAMLLMPLLAFAAKKDPVSYNLTFHVSSSRVVSEWGLGDTLRIIATVDGENLELRANTSILLRKGDYKARLEVFEDSDEPVPSYVDKRAYEFLLPDGKKKTFQVVGEPEGLAR